MKEKKARNVTNIINYLLLCIMKHLLIVLCHRVNAQRYYYYYVDIYFTVHNHLLLYSMKIAYCFGILHISTFVVY